MPYFHHETAIIDDGAFIGAGAVITKDVPDHALMVGNPARQIGWMCQCGERLSENLVCFSCQKRYQETETGLCEIVKGG